MHAKSGVTGTGMFWLKKKQKNNNSIFNIIMDSAFGLSYGTFGYPMDTKCASFLHVSLFLLRYKNDFFWCLGKAVLCYCGISWSSTFTFLCCLLYWHDYMMNTFMFLYNIQ